jgi:serine/threonine-protein kinase
MGAVFLARHRSLDRLVAVKTVQGLDEQRRRLFVLEGRALGRLDHPNILRVHDADEAGVPYLVFEYVEGGSLRDLMLEGRVHGVGDAVGLVLRILDGLGAAHGAGIVHRDIKPENILLPRSGGLKIADFGLARVERTDAPSGSIPGFIVGTPSYMAPEQVRGERCGPPADLYATGVLLFELLANEPPFVAPTLPELLVKHLNEPPPDLAARRPYVSPALAAVVRRAMAKEVSQRHASAGELASALQSAVPAGPAGAALSARGAPADARPAVPPAAEPGRGSRVPAIVRTAVIVAAAALALQLWSPTPAPVDPRVVGRWDGTVAGTRYLWSVNAEGRYHCRTEVPGSAPPPDIVGTFTTKGSAWSLVSTGPTLTGQYWITSASELLLSFDGVPGKFPYRRLAAER